MILSDELQSPVFLSLVLLGLITSIGYAYYRIQQTRNSGAHDRKLSPKSPLEQILQEELDELKKTADQEEVEPEQLSLKEAKRLEKSFYDPPHK